MLKSSSSSCSEEDISGNRKTDEPGELSKADFLGWIAAKCKSLRKDSKTFFEFKALETFSELVAAILVKTYEKTVKYDETLCRNITDQMLAKLEGNNQNDRRGLQDIIFIWPFVKEFIEQIFTWKVRQQQSKKDFFIRRAYQETKKTSPPVLVTIASPAELDDDGPKSLTTLRKRRSAEGQHFSPNSSMFSSPNSSVIFVGSVGGCSPKVANWEPKREEKINEQPKKRRTGEEPEQRKDKTDKPMKQELIELDEQQPMDMAKSTGGEAETAPTNATHNQPRAPQEEGKQQEHMEEEEDEAEVYTLSPGDKSMFQLPDDPPQNEPKTEAPKTEEPRTLREVKREPEETGNKESEGRADNEPGKEVEDEEMSTGEQEEEHSDDEQEEEDEVTSESEGTDSPPPLPDKTVTRPYSPAKNPPTVADCESTNRSSSNADRVAQCKIEPHLGTSAAAASSAHCSSSVDGLHNRATESPQKRSEFDLDPSVLPPPKSTSPAKNGQRKYSGKIKIRKRKEYEAEQKLKRQLAIGAKVLRFSEKVSTLTFLIDEGNVISRPTANEKGPFFIAPSTTKFLKKASKAKSEGQTRRRQLNGQISADVREVVKAVEERNKELQKQLDSPTDELAIARGDRLVRFSRLLLADSLLQRLDEGVLKNAYVLRSLEHPRDIGLFIESGLNSNTKFLASQSHLVHFEFSYLFICYGYDQIVHCQLIPDPSEFLVLLRNWFIETLPKEYGPEEITLTKSHEEKHHYFYTPPRIVAVTIPEVGEHAQDFRTFNGQLRYFVSADCNRSRKTIRDDCILLLDWARIVAECSDGNALDSEEKRMQLLATEMKCEFGVLIK